MSHRRSRRKASRTGRRDERPPHSAPHETVLDVRRPVHAHCDQLLDAAIRAAQKRNREKADRAIRELFRSYPELQAHFGVEPKQRGRPVGSRETPSKVKRRIFVARSFGIPKVAILKALGYSPEAAAYRFLDRAVAEVETDQRLLLPMFNVEVGRAGYTRLSEQERAQRLLQELRADGDWLERLRCKQKR
jgi:hypothetical protein